MKWFHSTQYPRFKLHACKTYISKLPLADQSIITDPLYSMVNAWKKLDSWWSSRWHSKDIDRRHIIYKNVLQQCPQIISIKHVYPETKKKQNIFAVAFPVQWTTDSDGTLTRLSNFFNFYVNYNYLYTQSTQMDSCSFSWCGSLIITSLSTFCHVCLFPWIHSMLSSIKCSRKKFKVESHYIGTGNSHNPTSSQP